MVRPMKRIVLLAGLLLVALPTASATVTITAENGDLELMAGMTSKVPVTVTVSCDEFVMAAAQSITYAINSNAAADLKASHPEITVTAGAGCIPGNAISATGDITLNPDMDSFGLAPQTLKIWSVKGSDNFTYERSGNVWVAYNPGHTLTPDVTFPYTFMGGDKLSFNLTVDVSANSDTMVMFFPVSSTANGSVAGLAHQRFFFSQGENSSRILPVSWTPPAGNWDNATITFSNYSHCLLGGEIDPCEPQLEETVTWTIVNGAPKTTGDGEGKDSPGVGAGLIIGLLAVALVVLRRR